MSACRGAGAIVSFLVTVWLDSSSSFIVSECLRPDCRHGLRRGLDQGRVVGFVQPWTGLARSAIAASCPSLVGVLMQTKGGNVEADTRSAESSDDVAGPGSAPKKRRGRGIGKNENVAAAARSYKMSEMNFSSSPPLIDEQQTKSQARKQETKKPAIARNQTSSSPQGRWKSRLRPDWDTDSTSSSSRMLREGLNAQREIQKQSLQALMRKFTMLQQPREEEKRSSFIVNPGYWEKRRLENERSASIESGMGGVPLSELKRRGLIRPDVSPQSLHRGTNAIIKEWNTGSAVLDVKVAENKLYSAGADQVITEWDLNESRPTRTFEGHEGWITAIVIDSSQGLLISASDDQTVRVWDLRTSECLHVLRGHDEPLALELVDQTLAVACKGAVMVWNTRTWKLRQRLTNHTQVLRAMSAGLQVPFVSIPSRPSPVPQLSKRRPLDPRVLEAREASKLSGLVVGAVRASKKHLMASVDDGCIWVWNLKSWEVERKLLAPTQRGVWVRPLLVISSYNAELKREEAKL
uniref:Uncharacterized protein n=1 Tax=Guillardia theta TaxID=55529 RepID=A0A6U5VLS4_GUITH|mmetsp:Transcript_10628/g.35572  ORF Transcript_10628/g.35572 Transcript_10628/m.35572 type:complete len:522 (+) Transcript_10628:67-1632(+)